jgi:outer membrane immunogenic protein
LDQIRDIGATPVAEWSSNVICIANLSVVRVVIGPALMHLTLDYGNSMGVQDMFVRSLSIGVAAAALLVGGAQAADLIIPTTPQPIYESAGFSWDGLYAGARVGGQFIGDLGAQNYAGSNNYNSAVIGAAVGVNFLPADAFLLGAEVTGDYLWNTNVAGSSEFFANVRAGAVVTDSVLVYAIGGVGSKQTNNVNTGVYQLGGGVEVAVTDAVTVRGEIVGQGDFDGASDSFFESAKATVGAFYHF